MSDTSWIREASCSGVDGDAWTQPGLDPSVVRLMKKICRDCIVQTKCLEYALENNFTGIWGGTTASERKRIAQARRK